MKKQPFLKTQTLDPLKTQKTIEKFCCHTVGKKYAVKENIVIDGTFMFSVPKEKNYAATLKSENIWKLIRI